MRWRALVALVAAGMGTSYILLSGCQDATQIELDVRTNIPCGELRGLTIAAGIPGSVERAAPAVESNRCEPGGAIGTLIVTPESSDDAEVAFRVVVGIDVDARTCTPERGYGGCIVQRREVHYVPQQHLQLPIDMLRICVGVACDERTTCAATGQCVPARIANAEDCIPPKRCYPPGDPGTTPIDPGRDGGMDGMDGGGQDGASDALVEGGPFVLASGQDEPGGVAATESEVAWTERIGQKAHAIGIDGTALRDLDQWKFGFKAGGAITILNHEAWWVVGITPQDTAGTGLMRQSLDAGSDSAFVTSAFGKHPQSLIVNDSNIVFYDSIDRVNTWVDRIDGGRTTEAPARINSFLAARGTELFATGQSSISRGTTLGPPFQEVLVSGEVTAESIAATSDAIYWTRRNGGLVRTLAADGDGGVTIAQGENGPYSIAADESGVYWLTADGLLRRARDGKVTTLASGTPLDDKFFIRGIALTSKYVIWVTRDSVLRLDK